MDKDTQYRLEKGREHYENREYDSAEPYLLKVAETEDRYADVMNMLGVIYHDKGQHKQALTYLERALEINPRYTEAALNLAVVYNELGRYDKAKEIQEYVISLEPRRDPEIEPFARGKLANMHADLGRAYAELQLSGKAVEQYRQALALCPDFVDIRTRLGQILKDEGDTGGALVEFEEVKRTRPAYLPARISLGVTLFARGDKQAARREWAEVLESDPENRTAGMYLRMVDQLLAQEEAEAAGVPLEVDDASPAADKDEAELDFSFNGEKSSVMPAPHAPEDDDESSE